MARISATDFKVQTAAIAVALTAAYKDSVATRFAADFSDPREPLRDMMKFMTLNPATGVFTSNDDAVDAAYAGANSAVGTRQQSQSVTDKLGVALNSAAVEDALPSNIDLTFNQNIVSLDSIEVQVDAAVVPISNVVITGNTVVVTLVTPIVFGEVVTFSAKANSVTLDQVTMAAIAVTNNVLA